MESLFNTYARLVEQTSLDFKRYLYYNINWDNRLVIIRGARGVGKTTLMLQRIKSAYPNLNSAFYVSVDNIWFGSHTILQLVEYLYTHGVRCVFLDEVHKYPNWQQEIKNAYDSYPDLKLVVSGSSMLQLSNAAIGDLSRRSRLYTMRGLSFREFLNFEYGSDFAPFSLPQILNDHTAIADTVVRKVLVLPAFERYVRCGYFPFYKEEGDGFSDRLQRVVENVIENDIPSVSGIAYSSTYKIKHLLSILASQTPYTLNVNELSKTIETSRDSLLKIIGLLHRAQLTCNLYSRENFKALAKPQKILFDNTNIMYALSAGADPGTMRETFMASQLVEGHKVCMPQAGDLLADDEYLFDVGGRKKGYSQIRDVDHSFVAADDVERGFGNKIPLWLFGFLY